MLKHNRKTPGNKKRVRYGPVRYVNLKLDEPIFTNTYQISELCQKCGTVRSGPNINQGCKNCSIPKPTNLLQLNKSEFLSRTKRSSENLNQVDKENFNCKSKSYDSEMTEKKQDFGSNGEQITKPITKRKPAICDNKQALGLNEQKIDQNDEISNLSFGDKIKLLEKTFHPRELKSSMRTNQSLETTLNPVNKSQELIRDRAFSNGNIKINDRANSSKKENKVPTTIRKLFKDEKLLEPDISLNDFDRKSIAEFENIINFFENKKTLGSDLTRSLDNFEKSIYVETYQIKNDLDDLKCPTFGSNKSLDHSHFHVDNLNDIPRILESISKSKLEPNKKVNSGPFSETLKQFSKLIPRESKETIENSAKLAVPNVKPRKNLNKNSIKDLDEQILDRNCSQNTIIRPKQRRNIDTDKNLESFGKCKACCRDITSECVEAEGFLWHSEHFCCSKCKCYLADKKYLVSESNIFCLSCHQMTFSKICQTCKLGIDSEETRYTYEKLNWHSNSNCFKCYRCCKNLCDVPFLIKKNLLFCSMNCKKIFFDN